MKKLCYSVIMLSVILLCILFPCISETEHFSDIEYILLEDGTWEFTEYTSFANEVILPDAFDGCLVSSIANNAFQGACLDLLVIPETITHIGERAFTDANYIRSISLSKSFKPEDAPMLTRINGLSVITLPHDHPSLKVEDGVLFNKEMTELICFPNDLSMVEYTVPDSVISIADEAFRDNDHLQKIILPENLKSIGNYAFYNMYSLKSINIPDSVTSIGQNAFNTHWDFESLYMPDDLEYVGQIGYFGIQPLDIEISTDHPAFLISGGCLIDKKQKELLYFLGDPTLKKVIVPDGIEIINEYAFSYAENIEEILLPNSLLSIEDAAFVRCTSLKSIVIPDSVSHIGSGAFYQCNALDSVCLPQSLTEINDSVFDNCSSLTKIIFPDNLKRIGDQAFYACTSLESVILPNSITEIAYEAFSGCESLTEIHLPDKLETLGTYALYECCSLKHLSLPLSLTDIRSNALDGTTQLSGITVPDDHPVYGYVNGMLIDKNKQLVYYAVKEQLNEHLILPEGMIEIGAWVFSGADNIKSIVIPEGYEIIGSGAFYGLSELSGITLPNTLRVIGSSAFFGSEHVGDIIIPESVEIIGSNAFITYGDNRFLVYPDSYAHKWAEENWNRHQVIE